MGGTPRSSLAERMAHVARQLQQSGDPQGTMDAAVQLAVANVEHCDAAGITLVHRRRELVETPAYTCPEVLTADQIQYEVGEGPCLDALQHEALVHSRNLARDERWPTWGARVGEETGFHSIFCFRLFTHDSLLGGLNLYSTRESAFDGEDREDGVAIAAHIAVAVAAAREIATAEDGLHSRSTIGQAMGILMERFDLGPDRALEVLGRLASHGNVKLRDVAAEVVATRRLPEG